MIRQMILLGSIGLWSVALMSPDEGAGGAAAAGGGEGGGEQGGKPAASTTILGGAADDGAGAEGKKPSATDDLYGAEGKKPGKAGAGDAAASGAGKDDKAGDAWKEYVDDPKKSKEENAAAKAEHDKTKPEAGDDKKGKKAEAGEERTPEQIAETAKSYRIEPPEGFNLDPEVDQQFRTFAAELDLDQAQVDRLKEMQLLMYERQADAVAAQAQAWGEQLQKDKDIGGTAYKGNVGLAIRALDEFFAPDVKAVLDKTGLGSHPEIVKGFVRLGKAMGEMPTLRGGQKDTKPSITDVLYPDD